MRSSYYLTRFLPVLALASFFLYLALRTSSDLSHLHPILTSLTERAELLHQAITSPLAKPRPPFKLDVESEAESEPLSARPNGRKPSSLHLPDGLGHAINSFEHYPSEAVRVLERKRERYERQNAAQKALSQKLGYEEHFTSAKQGIRVNRDFTNLVASVARDDYKVGSGMAEDPEDAEFGLVDLSFGHLSRDWSSHGEKERQAVFPPVLGGLGAVFGRGERVHGKKVLVPGSGMGRLASDIADLGYDVDANEMDYGSILTYHVLLNHTSRLNEHVIHPFVTKWTHQLNPTSRFQPLTVPDHWPNPSVRLVEGDFLKEFPVGEQYDAVVTLFFIDMSENIIDFLSNIHRLLKPGGLWINLGPFKWGTHSDLQLSAEEVLRLAKMLGFDIDHSSRRSIDSLYAGQPDTLLKFTYVTQFWTARKTA